MTVIDRNLFDKIEDLAITIKQEFKRKGFVIPSQHKDGSVQIGGYFIVKKDDGYWINNRHGNAVEGPLNLARTAIVVANELALGKWVDTDLITKDRWYGFKAFDERVANAKIIQAINRDDNDRADVNRIRAVIAREQKLHYKKDIDSRFAKLRKLA
jgi:hypothetical protein